MLVGIIMPMPALLEMLTPGNALYDSSSGSSVFVVVAVVDQMQIARLC